VPTPPQNESVAIYALIVAGKFVRVLRPFETLR
jgi:hypothetical protein